ncbi:capsular polysaccharide biosynthesis protein [Holosporaceae bacterium 'Namur']|nr:capsular polysaccharide biosynthesis protein [Holosporaceae bacterium 'Namur']
MNIGTTSKGIYNIPQLKYFFPREANLFLINRFSRTRADMVVGWGNKPSSVNAKKYAEKYNLPYTSLEDGFIRSLAPAKICPSPFSIIFDDIGIYYDASKPSQLENLITANEVTASDLERAKNLIRIIKQHKISKYNHAPENLSIIKKIENYVLVIDQTYNDLSVSGSLSNAITFQNMLEAAIDENPSTTVLVKTHPEVVAGYKKGYLTELAKQYQCQIISEAINPWSLLSYAQKVYTVSSQMGFEALMAEKPVRCFGLPFYAGWGLTIDEQTTSRRNQKRNLYEIFIAAYLKYSVYLNPFTLQKCELEEILPITSLWKDINRQNIDIKACTHISKWKQKSITNFLKSIETKPRYYSSIKKAIATGKTNEISAWASKLKPEEILNFRKQGIKLNLIEDGFLRSVGLGANLITPQSIVIDKRGIYYDHHSPSDLECIIQNTDFSNEIILRAKNIIKSLNKLEITKYNVGFKNTKPLTLPPDMLKILVVGQVENDASIKLGTVDIKTNLDLLKTVREKNPLSFIIYKPHPDCVAGQRRGMINNNTALQYADLILDDISIIKLIDECDEVHTLTSLTGFEALIRGKRVSCYGLPFYSGWGLTNDLYKCFRRNRQVTIEELVAGTLIIYPRYLDPKTNLWCSVEVIIDRLNEMKQKGVTLSKLTRLRTLFGKLKRMRISV